MRGGALGPAGRRSSLRPRVIAVPGTVAEALAALAIVVVAAGLRLWSIGTRPGFDWDEPVYSFVARSVAEGHGLYAKPSFGVAQSPYLFHPPFHFELLGGWFAVFGAGVAQARVLAALTSLVTLALVYRLLRARWGAWALGPCAVLATDGWLVFTNRVSWIENSMMVLAVGGLVAYDRAVRAGGTRRFVAAGVLLGGATVYKHVGVYVLFAVLAHWALTRRHARGHVALAGAAFAVVALYVVAATAFTLRHGHAAFLDDSRVQLERLTGRKASRGSIGGSAAAFGAITGPYRVFAVTLLLTGAAALVVLARGVQAAVARRTDLLADPLLFCWAAAALVSFAALRLKMGHYFMMVELPLLLYLGAEMRPRLPGRRALGIALLAAVLVANLVTFDLRFVRRDDNALAAVAAYTHAQLPPGALVLTEESVGSIIRQPYCKLTKAGACFAAARYLIIYRSRTQAPPATPLLDSLLRYAVPLRRFAGFKERITVYRAPGTGPICAGERIRRGFCDRPGRLLAATRDLRPAGVRARVRFGRSTALVTHPALAPFMPLPSADAPAVVLLGIDRSGAAVFFNAGRARVSQGAACRPSPARCQVLTIPRRRSAHLEVPTVAGRTIPYELKLDATRRRTPSPRSG